MKIISYNIEAGFAVTRGYYQYLFAFLKNFFPNKQNSIHSIGEFISSENPDFIFLNEVDTGSLRSNNENQLDTINSYTKSHAIFFSSTKGWNHHQGNAILSRFPIVFHSTYILPGNGERRVLGEIEVQILNKKIRCFVTHLSLNKYNRSLQIKEIVKIISNLSTPFILCGDFNTENKEELAELFKINVVHFPTIATFPSWKPKRALDYVFVSKDFKLEKIKAAESIQLSDHLPLIAEIEFS